MRFNDMIGTVMAQPKSDPVSRQIMWRQMVDILAQGGAVHAPETRASAIGWLNSVRSEVAPNVRASVARSIAPRLRASDLVACFASDDVSIAAPVIRYCTLTADQWQQILPAMPVAARALLRERRDLPDGVAAALTSFGRADFALQSPVGPPAPDVSSPVAAPIAAPLGADIGQTPIAVIVARIEAFRAQRAADIDRQATSAVRAPSSQFHFETDAQGDISFVTGGHRSALCGISIAMAEEGWLCGVDGHAAGAFRARSAFSGARLRVAGSGAASGDWLIKGAPVFDPALGKFIGYRGSARRPMQHERAEHGQAIVPFDSNPVHASPSNDSMRQLAHELRTPLNAILGFAEMIEREMLGPVAPAYRMRARIIIHEGNRLLGAIEDVESAAHLDGSPPNDDSAAQSDAAALLTLVGRELGAFSDECHIHLRITRAAAEMPVSVAPAALHRLLSRLMSIVMGLAEKGEILLAALSRSDGGVVFSITRPRALLGREPHELLDPDYAPDGDWPDAPVLGLAFGLRLIDNLAKAADVKFRMESERFTLILPATQDTTPQATTTYDNPAERNRTPIAHGDDRPATGPATHSAARPSPTE